MADFALQAQLRDYHQTNTTVYDDARMTITIHKIDQAGGLQERTELVFDDLILQAVVEAERERFQTLPASDENKLFAFGSDHKIFSISGILADTALDNPVTVDNYTWSGRSYREFVEFVENEANIGVCAEKQQVVSLDYASRRVYGAFVAITGDIDANQPHIVPMSAQFYVLSQLSEDLNDTDS